MNLLLNQSKNRLDIQFPYSPPVVMAVRGLGARWDKGSKVWHMGLDLPSVEAVRTAFPHAYVDPAVKAWQAGMREKINANGVRTLAPEINYEHKTNPYDHQVVALNLVNKNNFFALCMEMGTGKTKPIIDLITHLKQRGEFKRALIVAPLSVVGNWPNEANVHGRNLKCSLLVGDRNERLQALKQEADIYVINYAGMRIMADHLAALEWDVMVCDESQNIKNRTAEQAKACYDVGARAKRRYILTGTLVTNKPLDVFGQYKFLSPQILGANYFAFQSRYAIMVQHGLARFPVKFVNLEELSDRLAPWNFRVLKKDCLDLPEKIYETRYAEFHPAVSRLYKTLGKELAAEIQGGRYVTAPIILTKLLRFSQLTAGFVTDESGQITEVGDGAKTKVLLELLEDVPGKVVVWVKFKKEMELVKNAVVGKGYGVVSLSGDDSSDERQDAIRRFYDDVGVKVFIGQIEAGGTGINLTCASTCVYMSNSYSLGTRLQSEDRLHRIGQKNNVTYCDIVIPGTIDEAVLKILRGKKDLADIINKDGTSPLEEILNGRTMEAGS